jgi:hypothetical protein
LNCSTAQLCCVVKRQEYFRTRCVGFGIALAMCVGIACNGQILAQMIAGVLSLDHDHHISLHDGAEGIVLILTHDEVAAAQEAGTTVVASPSSDTAHIIRIPHGITLAEQASVAGIGYQSFVAPFLSASLPKQYDPFAPRPALVYSRPPPSKLSILPLHRSTVLLI